LFWRQKADAVQVADQGATAAIWGQRDTVIPELRQMQLGKNCYQLVLDKPMASDTPHTLDAVRLGPI